VQENGLAKGTRKLSGAVYQADSRKENRQVKHSKRQGHQRKSTIQQLSHFTFPEGRVPSQAGPYTQHTIQQEVEEFTAQEMQCSQLSFWFIPTLLHVCKNLPVLFSLAYHKLCSLASEDPLRIHVAAILCILCFCIFL